MDLQLNIALTTLQMKPPDRPDASVESVAGWLREKSKIFKQLDDSILTDVARNCSLQKFAPNHVLIRQGEIGDCFYIILQGQVAVYICTDLEPGKLAGIKDEPANNKDEPKYYSKRHAEPDKPAEEKKDKLDRNLFGKHIVTLSMGASFGELALINDDCIRNASVITDEPTHFICIDRALYNRSLKGFQARDFEDRNNFVETHPIFAQWPWRLKRQVAMSLERTNFDFDSVISKQGKPASAVHFIFRGTARLVYNSATMHSATGGHIPRPSINYDMGSSSSLSLPQTGGALRQRAGSTTINSNNGAIVGQQGSSSVVSPNASQRQVELCSITNGEAIGDLEMFYPLDVYLFTTVAASPTEVLSLSQGNMTRFLENKVISKMMVDLLSHSYYRLLDRVERNIKCPIVQGIFGVMKQIVELAEAKKEQEAANRMKRAQHRKAHLASAGKSAGGARPNHLAANNARSTLTPTVAPPTNAFRRFITREDDDETTLHYMPHEEPADLYDEADVPPEAKIEVFPDWETSDERLSALEARIRKFNTDLFAEGDDEGGHHRRSGVARMSMPPLNVTDARNQLKVPSVEATNKVVEMRRYTISGQQGAPRAGTLVKVRMVKSNQHGSGNASPVQSLGGGSRSPGASRRPVTNPATAASQQRNVTFSREVTIASIDEDSTSLSDRPRSYSLSGQRPK